MSFKEIAFPIFQFQNEDVEDPNSPPVPLPPVAAKKPKERHVKKSGSFMRRDRRNNSRLKPKKTPE